MSLQKVLNFFRRNRLLVSILAGVFIGCAIGIAIHDAVQSSTSPSPKRLAMYVNFPGELFIRMLKMIVVPLITSSVIVALTDEKSSAGRLGKRTMIYYLSTTIFSATLGLILGKTISPGSGVNEDSTTTGALHRNSVDSFLDLLRNCFPDNIMEAMFRSVYTVYEEAPVDYRFLLKPANTTSNMSAKAMAKFVKDNLVVPRSLRDSGNKFTIIGNDVTYDFGGIAKGGGTNMIGLIVFSVALGAILKLCKEEGKPLVDIFRSLWSATMKLVEIIMWVSPVGIASIIAGNIIATKDIWAMFGAMGKFVLCMVVGSVILAFVVYPALYLVIVRRNPFIHVKNVLPALVTALGTSSSAATLPTTIECCESRAKIDKRVTRFVLPIGATCNMDGMALYLTVTVLFVDQIDPTVNLGSGETALSIIIATVLSIGSPAVPGPGITSIVIILEAVGLPIINMGPVVAVFWFNDRLITVINVMGDTYGAAVVEKISHAELTAEDRQELQETKPGENVKQNEIKDLVVNWNTDSVMS